MPEIGCPIDGCTYTAGDVDVAIATALLVIHNNAHVPTSNTSGAPATTRQKAPQIKRPKISGGSSEETWNAFLQRWSMFKTGTDLSAAEKVQHLFQCCDDDLGDSILRGAPSSVAGNEEQLVAVVKKFAVVPVAICIPRAELIARRQDHEENIQSFYAKLKGKAATCVYATKCPIPTCGAAVDFTDIIVKDVIIAGLVDEEIKKKVLGLAPLDEKDVDATVPLIEAKEMACDALNRPLSHSAVSSYKKKKFEAAPNLKGSCKACGGEMEKYVWNQRQGRMMEYSLCLPCWRKSNPKKGKATKDSSRRTYVSKDETSMIVIGAMSYNPVIDSSVVPPDKKNKPHQDLQEIVLDHHIFHSPDGWKKSESMAHPTLRLRLTTNHADYDHIGAACPSVVPSFVTAVTETGAQSCLWSLQDFY